MRLSRRNQTIGLAWRIIGSLRALKDLQPPLTEPAGKNGRPLTVLSDAGMDFIGVAGPAAKPRGRTTVVPKCHGVKAQEGIQVGNFIHRDAIVVFARDASCLATRICSRSGGPSSYRLQGQWAWCRALG